MSRLVRLYPQAWRDRYEEEFLILLEERPPTTRDVVDTVRGAVDAHLHPHLAGGDAKPSPWTHRIPGLLALAAGTIYLASIVGSALLGATESAWSSLAGWSLIVTLVSLAPVGCRRRNRSGTGVRSGGVMLAVIVPWSACDSITSDVLP